MPCHHPGAATLVLGLAVAGCASVEKTPAAPWRIEALWRLDNGVVPGSGAAYFALGRKYEGEGRWQQAAEAYRKASVAEPANAEYRNAVGLMLAAQPARPAPEVAAAATQLHVQSTPTLPAMTVLAASANDTTPPAAAVAAAAEPAIAPARIEIVNGNGIRGAAATLRGWLGDAAGPATRLSNRAPYRVASSVIEYRPGFADQARAIARRMPMSTRLVPSPSLGSDVRVVLGHDLKQASACTVFGACTARAQTLPARWATAPAVAPTSAWSHRPWR